MGTFSRIFTQPGKTQAHFRKTSNINEIFKKYVKTGILVEQGKPMAGVPQFGVFEQFDFLESQNKVVQAKMAFNALPSRIRARFSNDPSKLLQFLGDEKNRSEAISIGLLTEIPAKELEKTPEVVPETPQT